MESSRSDHPSQTVNSSDRQPSQTVSCSDRQSSQTVSCSDRQLRVRGSVADEVAGLAVAAVEGNASDFAETHNEESLQAMEGCWQWSDVDQCWITDQPIFSRNRVPRIPDDPPTLSLQPNGRYTIWMPTQRFATQRQQDFVDEDVGREDGWQWLKDDGGGLHGDEAEARPQPEPGGLCPYQICPVLSGSSLHLPDLPEHVD